jgi:hypothetical protein
MPETPAQAVARLTKEINDLKKLRAQVPLLILGDSIQQAIDDIKAAAADFAIPAAAYARPPGFSPEGTPVVIPGPETPPETPPVTLNPGDFVRQTSTSKVGRYLSLVGNYISVKWLDLSTGTIPVTDFTKITSLPPPVQGFTQYDRVIQKSTSQHGYINMLGASFAQIIIDGAAFKNVPYADLQLEP